MPNLNQKQLLALILRAIADGGWQALLLGSQKPFRLRLFQGDNKGFDVQIYIWNCTHGGGKARAADEYRVQLTGEMPSITVGAITLLLGWHFGYGVFVGFDINKHNAQSSQSPSIQIKEETLQNAHARAFAIHLRQNDEIAVAFRPEFLVDYALNATSLHLTGEAESDMSMLNNLSSVTEEQIVSVRDNQRQIAVAQIARKYRASDFRRRVLGAYSHSCGVCGVQMELIDAAHIVPVAASTSTDETINGIALCKLHHAAFDKNLLSFDERYKIEISETEISRLISVNRAGGLRKFKQQLRTAIILPSDQRDYPLPQYITEARKVRNWV